MDLTYIIKYTDNQYKVKWVVKDMMSNKGSFTEDCWGYYEDEIRETIKKNDNKLFTYLANKGTDLNF